MPHCAEAGFRAPDPAATRPLPGATMVKEDTGHPPAAEHLLHADDLLRVTCTVRPGPSLVRLEGEIDVTNRAEALAALTRAHRIDGDLVIDVGGVSFIDVGGLRTLLRFAEESGAEVRNAPHRMRRLMDVLGLPPLG